MMQEGVFAFIDCLGFKGIWKREDYKLIIDKFKKIKNILANPKGAGFLFPEKILDDVDINFRVLSDTIVFSFQPKVTLKDSQKEVLVFLACDAARRVCELFIENEPYITLRGCITYGNHVLDDNLIIGQAVDEAAEFEKIAEGAFIWLTPRAAIIVKTIRKEYLDYPLILDYKMPIKGGQSLKCAVINPLLSFSSKKPREIIELFSKAMTGDRIDIWLKHQNTMEFLEYAITV